ncbi:DUF397 domain-containing protein [Actinacidiphila guanduensis]|uniref:DUF397 domain-containing protein n=1 Tax=Actinacidiphila guanduensis TaxID=310781 RepID=A0A1H0NUL7_9ACTN|nr:DUF397 domain-containing protein [Actinacidiphila guanduensis]SDO96226.1 protein of unknown function [Actinacidiphila guanduensis]
MTQPSHPGLDGVAWRKSSYSNQEGGDCVEVAVPSPTAIAVRDSKNPHGPALVFTADAWTSFVDAVRAGQFPVG